LSWARCSRSLLPPLLSHEARFGGTDSLYVVDCPDSTGERLQVFLPIDLPLMSEKYHLLSHRWHIGQHICSMIRVEPPKGSVHHYRARLARGAIESIDEGESYYLLGTGAPYRNGPSLSIDDSEPIGVVYGEPSVGLLRSELEECLSCLGSN